MARALDRQYLAVAQTDKEYLRRCCGCRSGEEHWRGHVPAPGGSVAPASPEAAVLGCCWCVWCCRGRRAARWCSGCGAVCAALVPGCSYAQPRGTPAPRPLAAAVGPALPAKGPAAPALVQLPPGPGGSSGESVSSPGGFSQRV